MLGRFVQAPGAELESRVYNRHYDILINTVCIIIKKLPIDSFCNSGRQCNRVVGSDYHNLYFKCDFL